ncbi:hypothetical protein GQ600_26629 [Phytophthora cactorum]|nr:hypothetical protein GQ600_26629 [Phytophthora cactorum]
MATTQNKLRGADSEADEEKGIFTTAKLKLWLKLGVGPEKGYQKLHLPRNHAYAPDHKNWGEMKQSYNLWLNKMAAKKPPTKA